MTRGEIVGSMILGLPWLFLSGPYADFYAWLKGASAKGTNVVVRGVGMVNSVLSVAVGIIANALSIGVLVFLLLCLVAAIAWAATHVYRMLASWIEAEPDAAQTAATSPRV